jgi:TRAP-type uncharacterized transport system fused permease subunit
MIPSLSPFFLVYLCVLQDRPEMNVELENEKRRDFVLAGFMQLISRHVPYLLNVLYLLYLLRVLYSSSHTVFFNTLKCKQIHTAYQLLLKYDLNISILFLFSFLFYQQSLTINHYHNFILFLDFGIIIVRTTHQDTIIKNHN